MRNRILATCTLALISIHSAAYGWRGSRPRLIDDDAFMKLVAALQAEAFADGKLTEIRRVAAGRRYLFRGIQATTLLDSFTFWNEQLDALRLLPLVSPDDANAVLKYFGAAPGPVRSEAQRILNHD